MQRIVSFIKDASRKLQFQRRLSLSKEAAKALRINRYFNEEFVARIKQIYYPSPESSIILILIFIILFILSQHRIFPTSYNFAHIKINYDSLASIYIGITTFIFAFIIFIAEFLKSNAEKARVLLKGSKLYPITVISLFCFIFFAFIDPKTGNNGAILVIAIIIGLITFSFYKAVQLLLNPSLLKKQEIDLIKGIVQRNIKDIKKERVANNIYAEFLEKSDFDIMYTLLSPHEESYFAIRLNRTGVITDIYLDKLSKLLQRLEELAGNNNATFIKNSVIKRQEEKIFSLNADNIEYLAKPESEKKTQLDIFIVKKYQDSIDESHKQVIYIPKRILSEKKIELEIIKQVNSVFKVEGSSDDLLSSQVQYILSTRKDEAIDAIHTINTTTLDYVLNVYSGVIKGFLEAVSPYKASDARKELNSLFGTWPAIKWAEEDIFSILKEAVKSEDIELINKVFFVIYETLTEAIKHYDHLVFQGFIQFYVWLFSLVPDIKNNNTKQRVINNIYLNLNEIITIFLNFDNPELDLQSIKENKDFYIEIFKTFQYLIRNAYDTKDYDSFKKILLSFVNINQKLIPYVGSFDKDYYKFLEEQGNLSESELKEVKKIREKKEIIESVKSTLRGRQNQVIWGLSSWVLYNLSKDFDSTEKQNQWKTIKVHVSGDIGDLTKHYLTCRDNKVEQLWGWSFWGVKPYEVFIGDNVFNRLDYLYCIKLLQIVNGSYSLDRLNSSYIKSNTSIPYLIESTNSPLRIILNEVKNNFENWKKVIPTLKDQDFKKTEEIFDTLLANYREEERKTIIETKLKSKKVKQFCEELIRSYYQEIFFKKIFINHNQFFKRIKRTKDKIFFGKYEILDKTPFIQDEYKNEGNRYGSFMAQIEDNFIFSTMRDTLTAHLDESQFLEEKITAAIRELVTQGYIPSVILLSFHPVRWYMRDLTIGEFESIKDDNRKNGSKIGVFKIDALAIDVLRFFSYPPEKTALVLDIDKFADFIQYEPYRYNVEKEYQKDLFFVKIADLAEDVEKRDEIVTQDPDWLKEVVNTPEGKQEYLKQKVLLRLYERFKLEIKDKRAGFKIQLKKENLL